MKIILTVYSLDDCTLNQHQLHSTREFFRSKLDCRSCSLLGAVSTVLDADIVCDIVLAVGVVPEVVAVILEDYIPVLHVGHAVLSVEIVGLVVSPVKPLDTGIGMRPPPVSIDVPM